MQSNKLTQSEVEEMMKERRDSDYRPLSEKEILMMISEDLHTIIDILREEEKNTHAIVNQLMPFFDQIVRIHVDTDSIKRQMTKEPVRL